MAYANDLPILTDKLHNKQPQINLLNLNLNLIKCAITGCPNKSNLKPNTFKAFTQAQNIIYKTKNIPRPSLIQNKLYTYLEIHLVPSFKWKIPPPQKKSSFLTTSPATSNKIKYSTLSSNPGLYMPIYYRSFIAAWAGLCILIN